MNIRNFRLKGAGIANIVSPNHGARFEAGLPDTIIFHFTNMDSVEEALQRLSDPAAQVSAHLVIARDGSITQLVPFNTIAWHAGRSAYMGRSGFNKYAIGIEIDNAGRLTKEGQSYKSQFGKLYLEADVMTALHPNESGPSYWHRYTEKQISVVADICLTLSDTYGITTILGHEEVAPQRKDDPGPAFPLDELRTRVPGAGKT